ncbi:hypothetical protein LTR37_017078 [Vermiconidia calcicola]|uniref:Uncharacterized protein n=1 Tax=Vermiconidia calcicola TaxID=1690605 RepID=A0ACC3MKY7_9PEZI|nr:hypothetical protein LTR37_017078 [Vermiconidia calcicola]
MKYKIFEYFNKNVDDENNRMLIGTCTSQDSQPGALVYASLNKIRQRKFDISCGGCKSRAYGHVNLPDVLYCLPEKEDMRAALATWMTFREEMPEQEAFDIGGLQARKEDNESDDENDEPHTSPNQLGAVARGKKIILAQELIQQSSTAPSAAPIVHGALHIAREFLFRSGDADRFQRQVDTISARYLPEAVHGIATELSMRGLGNRLRARQFQDFLDWIQTTHHITNPVPHPANTQVNVTTRSNDIERQERMTGQLTVPPPTDDTDEQIQRMSRARHLRRQ